MSMWTSFPVFGSALILGVMLVAAYTFAVAMSAASTGRPRTLQAARLGAYGTVGLTAVSVLSLAYAFASHDFRLRYVAHYSDRSMPKIFLLTALWGGQDGSLLWWLFLLSLYIGFCVAWLGKKHLALQPYIIATFMAVVLFFCVLMTFAANPFSTSVAGTRADGEGLNPLLQNFYMIIHPPSLYVGFVGCTVPFAFAMAALLTGRLDHEWIVASRKWTLFAWLFLGIGNTLGMAWAYEELGWGGYWAWDPVENAAFMPFLTASAFVHSVMIQERRGLLKVWNVFLICLTFFMTIFGTFLTRSGAIASVHSFAQSSIGTYFAWFLGFIGVFTATVIAYRWPELRDIKPTKKLRTAAIASMWFMLLTASPGIWLLLNKIELPSGLKIPAFAALTGFAAYGGVELVFRRMTAGLDLSSRRAQFESVLSREFTFLLNNWALLGFMVFVLVATTFPMVSEALYGEKVTVGPPYYNAWVQPIGLVIFFLMGVGTLFGWKKTSPDALKRVFRAPVIATVVFVALHFLIGKKIGYPAIVWSNAIYPGVLGQALRAFNAITPVLGMGLAVFNATIIVQEFVLLYRARIKTGAERTPKILWALGLVPGVIYSLVSLPPASRRRYGGYIVHLGIVLMFVGFTGKSWTIDRETQLLPGQTYSVLDYKLEYLGPRMEVDTGKRMVFADLRVTQNGKDRGVQSPAKFIYKKMPDTPTTEVAKMISLRDDLYLVIGTVNPQTKMASLQIHVNPLVVWIWFGCLVLIFGSLICMWPQLAPEESRVWSFARGTASVAASVTMGIVIASMPAPAFAQQGGASSLHSGTVKIDNDEERSVFSALRCMCGSCARELLSSCACGWAEDMRDKLRSKMQAGISKDDIVAAYKAEFGSESLSIPPNSGAMRSIYLVPLTAIAASAVGLVVLLKRWRKPAAGDSSAPPTKRDAYDDRLDDELKDLDDR